MQEEVENKTVNFAVRTTKVSLKLLIRALVAYNRHRRNKKQLKQVAKNQGTKGKQSVKELIGKEYFPEGTKREDHVMWLNLLKKIPIFLLPIF